MAWLMTWYDDAHSIILFTIEKNSTWADYHDAMNRYEQELLATNKQIDVIINDQYGMPSGNPMPHFKSELQKLEKHRNTGLIVSVSKTNRMGFLRSIIEITNRFMGAEIKKGVFVKTIEEAAQRIALERSKAKA